MGPKTLSPEQPWGQESREEACLSSLLHQSWAVSILTYGETLPSTSLRSAHHRFLSQLQLLTNEWLHLPETGRGNKLSTNLRRLLWTIPQTAPRPRDLSLAQQEVKNSPHWLLQALVRCLGTSSAPYLFFQRVLFPDICGYRIHSHFVAWTLLTSSLFRTVITDK